MMAPKPARWIRSETSKGSVCWTCGTYVIERRHYTLPVRSKGYVVLRAGIEVDRADTLREAKELTVEWMGSDESEECIEGLREQARAVASKLPAKDVKFLFYLLGSYRNAHKVMRRHPKSWARFVELGLADPVKIGAKLCAVTELGKCVRTVLRAETEEDGGTLVWSESREPVHAA